MSINSKEALSTYAITRTHYSQSARNETITVIGNTHSHARFNYTDLLSASINVHIGRGVHAGTGLTLSLSHVRVSDEYLGREASGMAME